MKLPTLSTQALDPLATAASSVAWIIALNKPIYPIYVWYLANDFFKLSLLSALSLPLFAALPFIARKSSIGARAGLAAVGIADTTFISFTMGFETGAWVFLLPCLMLSMSLFYDDETWPSRIFTGIAFAAFSLVFFTRQTQDAPMPVDQLETLFALNAMGAASLAAFIALRFPRRQRG